MVPETGRTSGASVVSNPRSIRCAGAPGSQAYVRVAVVPDVAYDGNLLSGEATNEAPVAPVVFGLPAGGAHAPSGPVSESMIPNV